MLPLSRQQIVENQLVIATAYAKGANLDPINIYIDICSIRESFRNNLNGHGGLESTSLPLERPFLVPPVHQTQTHQVGAFLQHHALATRGHLQH